MYHFCQVLMVQKSHFVSAEAPRTASNCGLHNSAFASYHSRMPRSGSLPSSGLSLGKFELRCTNCDFIRRNTA